MGPSCAILTTGNPPPPPAPVQSCTRLSGLPCSTDTYCYSIKEGSSNRWGSTTAPKITLGISKPNTTSRAPDAVLRQPLTSYCCFYINSIVLWFVIFLGMKIIFAQIDRDHNAISKQTLRSLARSFVNTTKCAELCTQFA